MSNNNSCRDLQWTPLAPYTTVLLRGQLHATQLLGKSEEAYEAGLCPPETIVDYLNDVRHPDLRMEGWRNPHEADEMCLTIGSGFLTMATRPDDTARLEGVMLANDTAIGMYASGPLDEAACKAGGEDNSLNVIVRDFFTEARRQRELVCPSPDLSIPAFDAPTLQRLVRNISSYNMSTLPLRPVPALEMATVPVFHMAQALLSLASERALHGDHDVSRVGLAHQLYATRPEYQTSPNGVHFDDSEGRLIAVHTPSKVGNLVVMSVLGPDFPSPLTQYRIAPTHIQSLAPSTDHFGLNLVTEPLEALGALDESHASRTLPELELTSSGIRSVRNFIADLLRQQLVAE